jgi:hypothetical protein
VGMAAAAAGNHFPFRELPSASCVGRPLTQRDVLTKAYVFPRAEPRGQIGVSQVSK